MRWLRLRAPPSLSHCSLQTPALCSLGLYFDEVRLPLTRATPATQERLLAAMTPVMLAEEHTARETSLAWAG